MESFRKSLSRLPKWLFSILTILAILWLTLAPKPLGENPPPLFPGADKIAHGIMFGALVAMLMLDWQRKNLWIPVKAKRSMIYAFYVSIFGIVIEIAQYNMGLGRGFEYADILADTIGAFLFAFLYLFFQKFWMPTFNK